jgi:pyridoxine 5-phosphate synthase
MRLHINVDHVATVRQARRTDEPDPVRAAVLAELGGADGITVHLREDRRHVQDRDVRLLMETVRTGVNLELAAGSDVLDIAVELRPMMATLVPERREEITTEGGLALEGDGLTAVREAIERLHGAGIRVSLFVGPDASAIEIFLEGCHPQRFPPLASAVMHAPPKPCSPRRCSVCDARPRTPARAPSRCMPVTD